MTKIKVILVCVNIILLPPRMLQGCDVIQELVASAHLVNVPPIVMIPGCVSEDDLAHCRAVGASYVLPKPFSSQDLKEALDIVLPTLRQQ